MLTPSFWKRKLFLNFLLLRVVMLFRILIVGLFTGLTVPLLLLLLLLPLRLLVVVAVVRRVARSRWATWG
jgi:hypothetical protein